VEQIQSGVENRDALLIPIHIMLVCIRLGVDLLSDCLHKVGNNFVELFLVCDLCRLAML